MEDDWVVNVLEKCRIVSDARIQELWARILAGEANEPGSFSRKTVNLMSDLSKKDAELFEKLCCFVWDIDGKLYPLTLPPLSDVYTNQGITYETVQQLKDLGLLSEMRAGFAVELGNKETVAEYFGRSMKVGRVLGGNSQFTQAGLELYEICDPSPVEGFFNHIICDKWNLSY